MLGHDPVVSVVIPTHNRSSLLRRAIRSVLGQTFDNFELLVIDDASSDETGTVVRSFADPRVRYVRQPANSGVAHSRNVGLLEARGEFVSFLDDDDEYLPSFLAATVGVLGATGNEVAFSWCGILRVVTDAHDGRETIVGKDLWDPDPGSLSVEDRFIRRRFGASRGFTLKRWVLPEVGLFDTELRTAEDTEYFLRLVRRKTFTVVREHLVKAHAHPGPRLTRLPIARAEAYEHITCRYDTCLRSHPKAHAYMRYTTAKLYYAVGARARARRHLLRACVQRPLEWRYWRRLLIGETLGPLGSPVRNALSRVVRVTPKRR